MRVPPRGCIAAYGAAQVGGRRAENAAMPSYASGFGEQLARQRLHLLERVVGVRARQAAR